MSVTSQDDVSSVLVPKSKLPARHQKRTRKSTMARLVRTTARTRSLRAHLPPRTSLLWTASIRYMAAGTHDDKEETDATETRSLVESSLRGVGQVVFLNSQTSGLAILGGLAMGDPYVAALAAAGAVSATAAAKAAGLDRNALRDGLFGYNGCLVGCAAAVFISPFDEMIQSPLLLTATLVGGAASPFVVAALKPAMGTIPQWTLAFNFVTLSTLLRSRPFANMPPPSGPPSTIASLPLDQIFSGMMNAPLNGISQIFVVESPFSGAIILGAFALYSPSLAAHALMGSSIGALSGACMGADVSELGMGLWGFNSALTSVGVGVYYCHSKSTVALSAGGAVATAALFGALKTVFTIWDAPCLTLPFCITMCGCYLLKDAIPGLVLASNPHSPETNKPPPA